MFLFSFIALLEIYEWLLHFLLNETTKKFSSYVDSGVDRFTAKSKVQQFRAKDLALAFGQVNFSFIFLLLNKYRCSISLLCANAV